MKRLPCIQACISARFSGAISHKRIFLKISSKRLFEKDWEVSIFHRSKCNFPLQKRENSKFWTVFCVVWHRFPILARSKSITNGGNPRKF